VWEKNYKTDISHGSDDTLNSNAYRAYTDGSLTPGNSRAGAGALIIRNNKQLITFSRSLTNQNSVIQSEIYAIQMAADYLNLNADLGSDVHILVDSQAAIQAIGNTTISYNSVLQAQSTLNKLGENHQVTVRWIKARAAWLYNKAADKAAKKGANSRRYCPSPATPMANLKMELKLDKHTAWTNRWQTQTPARQSKFFFTAPNQKLSRQLLRLPKFNLSRIMQLTTGHCHLRKQNAIVSTGITPQQVLTSHADYAALRTKPDTT
jgi:ribonuclease HI